MLLPNMTPDEVRRELREDYEDLRRWMGHHRRKWARLALKTVDGKKTVGITGDYTTPKRKNLWIFELRILDRRMQHLQLCTGVLTWEQEGMAWTFYGRYSDENPFATELRQGRPQTMLDRYLWQQEQPPIIRFTPHFWMRLRERTGDRRYGKDLVLDFMRHNEEFALNTDRETINATGRRKEQPLTMVLLGGAGLGEYIGPQHAVINTFISSRQELGTQRERHQQLREKLPKPPERILT